MLRLVASYTETWASGRYFVRVPGARRYSGETVPIAFDGERNGMPHISDVIHLIRRHHMPDQTAPPAVEHMAEGKDGQFDGMPVARVASYQFLPGTSDEVFARVEQELLPLLKQQPGYLSYEAHRLDNERGVSISTWVSQEHADAAHTVIEMWAEERIGDYVVMVERYMSNVNYIPAS